MSSKQARQERDAGIKKAADHAEEVTPNWGQRAYAVLEDYLTKAPKYTQRFTCEDVREHAAQLNLPAPPHNRAWGAVLQAAYRRGLIRQIGVAKSRAPHCHCAHVGVWRKV